MFADYKVVQNYVFSLSSSVKSVSHADKVCSQLNEFAKLLKSSEQLNSSLCSPIVAKSAKSLIVEEIVKKNKFDALLKDFLNILVKHNRFSVFSSIAEEFSKLLAENSGIKNVTVSSAKKLSSSDVKSVQKLLEGELNGKINLEVSVDESLIGGIIVQYDSILIDCSLKGALDKISRISEKAEV